MEVSNRNFRWAGENIKLQPRMTVAVGREAIRSHLASPSLLISATVVGHTEGVNPTFGDVGDLGQGIAQIGTMIMQQPQL